MHNQFGPRETARAPSALAPARLTPLRVICVQTKAGKFALYSFDANTGTYKFTKTSDVSTGVMPGKLKFSADGTVVACVDSGSNSISYTSTRIYKGWTKSLTKNSMPPVSTLRSNRVLDPTNLIPTDLEFDITGARCG